MKRLLILANAGILLTGCATTPPSEVRMIPTADHGVACASRAATP